MIDLAPHLTERHDCGDLPLHDLAAQDGDYLRLLHNYLHSGRAVVNKPDHEHHHERTSA